jgi:hypothetical protein
MEPAFVAVSVVAPVTEVFPMEIEDPVPVFVRFKFPPVSVPVVEIVALLALSKTVSVPVPTLELLTVSAAFVSVTDVVPEVAVALTVPAFVFVIVAPPDPDTSDSVPVLTLVPPLCEMVPFVVAVRVVVPVTLVLPMVTLEPVPVFVRFNVPAVSVAELETEAPFPELDRVSTPVAVMAPVTEIELSFATAKDDPVLVPAPIVNPLPAPELLTDTVPVVFAVS